MLFQNNNSQAAVVNTNANAKNANTEAGNDRVVLANFNQNANKANLNTNTRSPTPEKDPRDANPTTDAPYIGLLILVALVVGAFGGYVSYLMNVETTAPGTNPAPDGTVPQTNIPKGKVPEWVRSMLVGIAAACLVPLFFHIISSQLLKQAKDDYILLLVYGGFCLVAAISAKRFITTLSNKVLQELEEAKVTANKANEKADKAQASAETAQGTASSARNIAVLGAASTPAVGEETKAKPESGAKVDVKQKSEDLIKEYNDTRNEMRASLTRTARMTQTLRQMIDLMPNLSNFDVLEHLNEKDDKGKRLLGYAYFFHKPDISMLPQLVDSVIDIEKTPFGQYWGILAIGRVIAENGSTKVDPTVVDRLRVFFGNLQHGTDRWHELKGIMDHLVKDTTLP